MISSTVLGRFDTLYALMDVLSKCPILSKCGAGVSCRT